jgi:uncharacterized protein with NAD-binding domain and iron-sulfur cluster
VAGSDVTTAGAHDSELPRVVILGGGVGSVTAAFELSKPGWRERFQSITLYQQGWRLGGKGACGRGPGLRIEEHGLHIWFGFYENAFKIMRECHEELDRYEREGVPRWPISFRSVEESFSPSTEISLTDHDGCAWRLWTADFFEYTDDLPWLPRDPDEPGPDDWSVLFYAGRCLHLAADLAWSLLRLSQGQSGQPGLEVGHAPPEGLRLEDEPPAPDAAAAALSAALRGDIPAILRAAGHLFDALATEVLEQPLVLELLDLIVEALQIAIDFLRGRSDSFVRGHDGVRRAWYVVDVMVAIVRGLIEDGVISAESFDIVNGVDFCDWLLTHGARRDSVDCALVRTVVYDLAFAYSGGDPQRPAAEAGTALRGLLRTFFTYRGALMWKMNSGMGDTIFAPLYELLVKRGVGVEFFHRVEAVRSERSVVHEIEIDVQADVPAGTTPETYLRPRLGQRGSKRDPDAWPNDPYGLLSAGGKLPIPHLDPSTYESWYADRDATRVSTKVLRYGVQEDDGFELVVFGFPISCVPHVARDLPDQSRRWEAAVDAVETVPTQAMQLWLRTPAPELAAVDPGIVAGGFVEPFDTWADMVHLVGQERVPDSVTVAYLCNVLTDSLAPPRGEADEWLAFQLELVRAHGRRFLSYDAATLWPRACNPLTRELYWDRLVDPNGGEGEERLEWQFFRANVEPSERYVLSVPGSSACRIPPDATGFVNLYAAGDWTSCTINAGCVEAAVISGMVAANGIHRSIGADAEEETIIGRSGP